MKTFEQFLNEGKFEDGEYITGLEFYNWLLESENGSNMDYISVDPYQEENWDFDGKEIMDWRKHDARWNDRENNILEMPSKLLRYTYDYKKIDADGFHKRRGWKTNFINIAIDFLRTVRNNDDDLVGFVFRDKDGNRHTMNMDDLIRINSKRE
jgi:hypothetical protein